MADFVDFGDGPGLIGGFAKGLEAGLDAYDKERERRRKIVETQMKIEAQKLKQQQDAKKAELDNSFKYQSQGFMKDDTGNWVRNPDDPYTKNLGTKGLMGEALVYATLGKDDRAYADMYRNAQTQEEKLALEKQKQEMDKKKLEASLDDTSAAALLKRKQADKIDAEIHGILPKDKPPKQLSPEELAKIKAETDLLNARANGIKNPKPKGPKQLSANELVEQADVANGVSRLGDLERRVEANIDKFGKARGLLSNVKSAFGYDDDASVLNSDMLAITKQIGKSIEGARMTDADMKQYEQMTPTITDTPETARGKILMLKRLVSSKLASRRSALQSGGYDVSGVPLLPVTEQQSSGNSMLKGPKSGKKPGWAK